MNINKSVVVEIIAVLLLISGIWYAKNNQFDPSIDIRTLKTASEFENYYKNLDELYKKDTYGGATPEETLQLFIDALKKGDTELASKYFVPEKQKKEAEDLALGKEKGNLAFTLNYLEKAGYGKSTSDNFYQMTVADDGKAIININFVKNTSSNKWKIESF